jgi:hypothetical protein
MDTLTGLEDAEDFFNGYELALARENAALRAAEAEAAVPMFTSEQLERAGRFRKPVAVLMGLLSALALLGLALQQRSPAFVNAARLAKPEAQALVPASPAPAHTAVTASLAAALPAPEPEAAPGIPSAKLDPASNPVSHEPTTLSAAFAVMTLAPVRPSSRRSAVADVPAVRMSSARPAAPTSAAAPIAPAAPAVARFPELEP